MLESLDEANLVEDRKKRNREVRPLITLFQVLDQALPKAVTTYGCFSYVSQ